MAVAVVQDVLVDLVREGDNAPLVAQPADPLQLRLREHLAGGVRWRVDHHHPGAGAERRLELRFVEPPLRRPRSDEPRLSPAHLQDVHMVGVERGEDHRLVARVEQGETGDGEAPGGTDGDEHFGVRVAGDPVVRLHLVRDGTAQVVDTLELGVDVPVGADRLHRGVLDRIGSGLVANPLAEIDAAGLLALAGHAAYVRLDETLGAAGEPDAGRVGHRTTILHRPRGTSGWRWLQDPGREGCRRMATAST